MVGRRIHIAVAAMPRGAQHRQQVSVGEREQFAQSPGLIGLLKRRSVGRRHVKPHGSGYVGKEILHRLAIRFSNHVSSDDPLNCGDASCLTRCRRALVSNSGHFFQNPSETTPKSPAEVLGRRAGAFAQFRHVTAGTKQVLAESPHRSLTGILVSTAGGTLGSMKGSAALAI
jgi:hypothetical protein